MKIKAPHLVPPTKQLLDLVRELRQYAVAKTPWAKPAPSQICAPYNHTDFLQDRRVMMQEYADYLDYLERNGG